MGDNLTPNPWQFGPNGELVGERIDLLAANESAGPVVGRAIRFLTGIGGDVMGALFGSTLLDNFVTAIQTDRDGMLANLQAVVLSTGEAYVQALVGNPTADPLGVKNARIIDTDGASSFVRNAAGLGTLHLATGQHTVNAGATPIPSFGSADFEVPLDPTPGLAPDAVMCWVTDGGDLYYGLKVTGTGDYAVNRFAATVESLVDTDLTAGSLNLLYLALYT